MNKLTINNIESLVNESVNITLKDMQGSGTILVGVNNKAVYTKSVGMADVKNHIQNTINTQYLIGSVTKQFTAVAILRAIYDNALLTGIQKENIENLLAYVNTELHKPISYYLSQTDHIWAGSMPNWANIVTLHNLLEHSSGIANLTDLHGYMELSVDQFKVSDLVSFFKDHELEFAPGEHFSYCNSGYILLSVIIQQMTGTPLSVYLETTFFKPLGMSATFLPTKGTVSDLKQSDPRFSPLANGYNYDISDVQAKVVEVTKYEPLERPSGAGSLISTTPDLLKWNWALYSEKIIPKCLLEIMLAPHILTEEENVFYGYGIEVKESSTLGVYYSHRGGIPGFRSDLTYIPSIELSIVCLTNVIDDWEKLMPEIKGLEAGMPITLTQSEKALQATKIIEEKYPIINQNRSKYNFMLVDKAIFKVLEDSKV